MKKYIALAALLAFISCEQFKEVADVQPVTIITANINVTSENVPSDIPRPENFSVKFINYNDKIEVVKTTDANGNVSVNDLIPGIYSITATGEIGYKGFNYIYNGTLANQTITQTGKTLDLSVNVSKTGGLVMKEIYFNGSSGYYFKDQFYEIYNNGEETQYADGLCIGTLLPLTASTTTYNWIVPDGHPENYAYFGVIWQVPLSGEGRNYPINPGESFIIAQNALDHNDPNRNPGKSIDLSGAEFETHIYNQTVNPDNPDAVNMELKFGTVYGTQWLASVFGCAYCIFYPDGEIDQNTWVQPQGSSTQAKEILLEWIVDGVELVNNESKITQKRMPSAIDAGATYTGATYNGKSVSRKIKETKEDARVLYWDTNNSSEDFQVNAAALVRRNGANIHSWNYWAN